MSGARRVLGAHSRWPAALVSALAAAAVLAGCATAGTVGRAGTASHAGGGQAGVTRTTAHAATTAPAASLAAGASTGCNPYASLTPQAGGPAVTAGSWAATIRARGYLIAGVDQTNYHWGYLNPLDGQIEGFDIDMVKDVAAAIFGLTPDSPALAAHIHFKAISDADRFTDVAGTNGPANTMDIVAYTATVNCERLKKVDFSSVYYDAKQRVLVDTPPSGPASAPNLTQLGATHQKVCATKGADSIKAIVQAHAIPVEPAFWSDCLVLLEEGAVAGVSTDDSILYAMKAQDPATSVTGLPLEDEPYGLVISKAHPDFVRFVNAVLARDRANGLWAKSYRFWVSATGALPTWPIEYAG